MKKDSLRGYLFEALVKKLVSKAGFTSGFISPQLAFNGKKFHGRGAVHQIDVYGEFCFSIPFIYPINILGEVKANKHPINITPVRNFCGVVKDINEWYRVDTKKGGSQRFSVIGEKRHTHCPTFFSMSGFRKTSLEYMYAQGIYPVTYENNWEIQRIYKKFGGLLKQIDFRKLPKRYVIFRDFEQVMTIPENAKKKDFNKRYSELMKLISNINSFFGMLGGKYIVNLFLKDKKYITDLATKDNFTIQFKKSFLIKHKNKTLGEFSFSKQFIDYYLLDFKKISEVFSFMDIFLIQKKIGKIIRVKFSEESLQKLELDLKK